MLPINNPKTQRRCPPIPPSNACLVRVAAILGEHDFVRVHIYNGRVPRKRDDVTVEIEVICDLGVTVPDNPGFNDASAEPDIVVVLARVATVLKRKGSRISFG